MGGAGRAIFEELRMIARRWGVVAVLFLLAFITIVDRVGISAAKSDMAADLGISDLSFGYVFGAFALGYALCMMPSGWAADVLGPRRCLTLSVCLWSVFTLATGLVQSLRPLIAVRVLFGGAEAGAFPTAARAIHNWLPVRERGVAMGLLNTGSRLGAALGLALTTVSISRIGWRMSFALLGAAGLAWAGGVLVVSRSFAGGLGRLGHPGADGTELARTRLAQQRVAVNPVLRLELHILPLLQLASSLFTKPFWAIRHGSEHLRGHTALLWRCGHLEQRNGSGQAVSKR
jgi:MFS family permease